MSNDKSADTISDLWAHSFGEPVKKTAEELRKEKSKKMLTAGLKMSGRGGKNHSSKGLRRSARGVPARYRQHDRRS